VTPDELSEILSCRQAAAEIRLSAGLHIYGPLLGEQLRILDTCPGYGCPGHSRDSVILMTEAFATGDSILALRN